MKISSLSQVVLFVPEMKPAIEFYRDILGLKVLTPSDPSLLPEAQWVEFETGACTLCLHTAPGSSQGPDAPQVVFEVSDLDGMRRELIRRGVAMGAIRTPGPGVTLCTGEDPFGHTFSLTAVNRLEL
ncbi:MAG: hypothetical protein Kow00107_08810 [Planctomycetota bacterium]